MTSATLSPASDHTIRLGLRDAVDELDPVHRAFRRHPASFLRSGGNETSGPVRSRRSDTTGVPVALQRTGRGRRQTT